MFSFPKLFYFLLFILFQTTVWGSFAILYFFHETYQWTLFREQCSVFLCYSNISPLSMVSQKRPILIIDIKVSPRLKLDSSQNFIICHCNSFTARNFPKKCFKSIFDNSLKWHDMFIWNLNFSLPVNDENVVIQRYNLVRYDDSIKCKRRGVCIYYSDSLPFKIIDIQYLQECINFPTILVTSCHFIRLYRSPNQSHDEFNLLIKNLELKLD